QHLVLAGRECCVSPSPRAARRWSAAWNGCATDCSGWLSETGSQDDYPAPPAPSLEGLELFEQGVELLFPEVVSLPVAVGVDRHNLFALRDGRQQDEAVGRSAGRLKAILAHVAIHLADAD